jgi:CheY-like chemotaxis protein
MPEKSGVRFYREMKQDEDMRHIPIIIVTGMADEFEGFISSRRQVPPPEGYIHKPIDRDALLAKARELTTPS